MPSVQRLARRSAGRQVVARAQRLSDELLTVEEQAYQAVVAVFDEYGPRALRHVPSDPVFMLSDGSVAGMLAVADQAAAESRVVVQRLFSTAFDMTIDCADDQLLLCERTLAAKYRGTTDVAMAHTANGKTDWVRDALVTFDQATAYTLGLWPEMVLDQVRVSVSRAEPREMLVPRLFSTGPLSLPGNGGVGMWWRIPNALVTGARTLVIGLMNDVMTESIRAWNDAAV